MFGRSADFEEQRARSRIDASPHVAEVLRDRVLKVAREGYVLPPLTLQEGAESIRPSVRPIPPPIAIDLIEQPVTVKGQVSGRDFTLQTSFGAFELWLSRQDGLLEFHKLPPPRLAAVVEFFLADFVEALEDRIGRRLTLNSISTTGTDKIAPNFGFSCTIGNLKAPMIGSFDLNTLMDLSVWASFLPSRRSRSLLTTVALRRGYCELTLQELRRLVVGDGLVIEGGPDIPCAAVVGERLVAPLDVREGTAVLLSAPRPAFTAMRHFMNSATPEHDYEAAPREGDIGSILIKVVFEIGRQELLVSEVDKLTEGYTFTLDRQPRQLVDIVAQGRIIGRGEITTHDDLPIVRVTSLVA